MSLKNAVGGVALLSGTAIGAAILALPVATAHLSFFSTLLLYILCWFFMLLGALYLLEVNLLVGYQTNLISMTEKTLGKKTKVFTWCVYLTLLYALTTAYLSGASAWLNQILRYFDFTIHSFYSTLMSAAVTFFILLMGTTTIDWINRGLMVGLISSFISLMYITLPQTSPSLVFFSAHTFSVSPLPIIITAFGSAIVVPSITEYLHAKPKQLIWVIGIGSFIPLIVYTVWEYVIISLIPLAGKEGLLHMQQYGHPVTDIPLALETILKNDIIRQACAYFSIFAITTSLLGVSLSLFDFLADGLHLRKNRKGKWILTLMIFIPPLFFNFFFPQMFSLILSFAGISVALLLGILPTLMAFSERRRYPIHSPFQVPGGYPLILVSLLFFASIIAIECASIWAIRVP